MSDWQEWLICEPVSEDSQEVRWSNTVLIGSIVKDVDGYWKFAFAKSGGLWEDGPLRLIADMLIELNMQWDENIKAFFEADRAENE